MNAAHLGLTGQDDRDADTPTTPEPVEPGIELIPTGTRHPGVITFTDPLCGHLPGDVHDEACAYWRGVATGEYEAPVISMPPFDLPWLREHHITAAQIERGAA